MQHASNLDQSIINQFKQYTQVFKHTPQELTTMALGVSAGLAMAGLQSSMLDLAISSDNIPLMIDGGLLAD